MEQLTYNEAFAQLEKLVHEVEDKDIQLDALASKIKRANELIQFCEQKLRGIEKDIADSATV
jgi:exodeoxyribonuclease VII small subunit